MQPSRNGTGDADPGTAGKIRGGLARRHAIQDKPIRPAVSRAPNLKSIRTLRRERLSILKPYVCTIFGLLRLDSTARTLVIKTGASAHRLIHLVHELEYRHASQLQM